MATTGRSIPAQMTLGNVVAGEWLKLRKQRSFFWMTLFAIGVSVAVSAVVSFWTRGYWETDSGMALDSMVAAPGGSLVYSGLMFGIGLCVWIAQESVSGSNLMTLQAVPRRNTLFAARLVLIGVASVVFAALVVLIGVGSMGLFVGVDRLSMVMTNGAFWATAIASLIGGVMIALISFATATLTRRSLSAAGILVMLFIVAPGLQIYFHLADSVPPGWPVFLSYLPGNLLMSATDFSSNQEDILQALTPLSPLVASLLMMAWCGVLLAAAAWRFARDEG